MEKNLPSKWKQKKSTAAILVSDKTDFKPTKIKKDQGGHYIMVKGSIQQEELMILYMYPIQEHPDTKSKFLTTYKET